MGFMLKAIGVALLLHSPTFAGQDGAPATRALDSIPFLLNRDKVFHSLFSGLSGPFDGSASLEKPLDAPVMITLAPSGERLCLPDAGLCLAIVPDTEAGEGRHMLEISDPANTTEAKDDMALPYHTDEGETLRLWPSAITLPSPGGALGGGSWIIGIVRAHSVTYSGGGGEGSRLHLHQFGVAPHAARIGPELLDVPWHGSVMIRACFGAEDSARRRGACQDEYSYGAALTLAPDDDHADALPTLLYNAQATAYPQNARRGEDSSAAPPLRASDLSSWRDPNCSFTRRFAINPLTGRYEADHPGPSDCESYWEP